MTQFCESLEMTVKRMGVERAKLIAADVAKIAVKNGLSQSQAEAVFEIAKDLLRTVPLGSQKSSAHRTRQPRYTSPRCVPCRGFWPLAISGV